LLQNCFVIQEQFCSNPSTGALISPELLYNSGTTKEKEVEELLL
jgi:hypothetical protein